MRQKSKRKILGCDCADYFDVEDTIYSWFRIIMKAIAWDGKVSTFRIARQCIRAFITLVCFRNYRRVEQAQEEKEAKVGQIQKFVDVCNRLIVKSGGSNK